MPVRLLHGLGTGSRRVLAASFFLTATVLGATGDAAAQDVPAAAQLTIPQARAIARQAALTGDLATADALSTALLARNPDDPEALMVRAVVARAAGKLDDAGAAAQRAYRLTDNPALKFDAAMFAADVLTRQERYSRAQFWLRRADQAAPDEPRRNLAANAYRQVAKRNPLQMQLRFSVRPSNNVNNGAETTIIEIGGLPFKLDETGQQLGGWEASTGLSLSFRLDESETRKTEVLGEFSYRKVWLSDDAKEKAPSAKGSDYDYGVIAAGIRHQRIIWPELGPSQVVGIVGQSWYGGDGLARWGEIQLGQSVKRGEKAALRFGLTARSEKRLDDGINDSTALGFNTEWIRAAEGGGAYSLGASVRNIWSDSATVDSLVLGLSAGRSFPKMGPVEPRITVSAENRDYRKWSSTPGGREDNSVSLKVDLAWPGISYYGFVPQASLTARRTWSDVDIYDRNEISLGLSAVSRF